MNSSLIIQSQLLATKFFVPVMSGPLIWRSRLASLLDMSLQYPLTLLSAPAGFGKTVLLSTWAQSDVFGSHTTFKDEGANAFQPATHARMAWLSLDEDDNDPQLFWTYVLSALDQQQPGRFTSLFKSLQSSQAPSLQSILASLINLVLESPEQLVLILDDYHVITEQQVHTDLSYLIKHLPSQLHIILATRTDPPLPLPLLRTRGLLLEIRTEQLRCTAQETKTFFQQVMALHLPDQTIQEVMARTEGWLVGLHLLALSLPEQVDPLTLLQQISGEHRYILDYLTEVVLQQQPVEVQHFLLSTCILERLNASLCDAVMEQTNSQQILKYLEQSNLFVVSLDHKRQWYRYHALFAETLSHQLEQSHTDLVPLLHNRASRWYAEHQQTTSAILHAFKAKEWHWAADLIEGAYPPLVSFTWGANSYALLQLRQWIEQLPAEILASRPHFCLACVHLLWPITPHTILFRWLDLAEVALRTTLELKEQESVQAPQEESSQEQRDLLGKVLTLRAFLHSLIGDESGGLSLGEQALVLLSPENAAFRAIAAIAKHIAYYNSSANDVMAAIASGQQAALLTQEAKQPAVTLCMVAQTALTLIGAGRLHEAEQLTQQALLHQTMSGGPRLPEVGWINICQAEILRERNDLASARTLANEAIALCEQSVTLASLGFLIWGYAVQIRVCLSCGDWDGAGAFLQQTEHLGRSMNQWGYLYSYSCFTIVDQVRLWLARGELNRAIRWAEQLEIMPQHLAPFARERQEVALARVLLVAKDQPTAALQRLEFVQQRAIAGQRWGHVIEIRLLQAMAHQKLDEKPQALAALGEAIHLAEPEGYLRTFVDEGTSVADLLSDLREEQRKDRPTPYLDMLLAAFAKESKSTKRPCKQSRSRRSL
jgi:LuxR family maltose regulon positive regulatory protein